MKLLAVLYYNFFRLLATVCDTFGRHSWQANKSYICSVYYEIQSRFLEKYGNLFCETTCLRMRLVLDHWH